MLRPYESIYQNIMKIETENQHNKKHGDKKVAVMGIIGIALLTTSILFHEVFHSEQHSEEMISVLITIAGSVTLIFSHLRNRRLCELENYDCHK